MRVVGVDDWAWKKGHNYGTILVDLERRAVADLLSKRSADQLADWLEQHPGVEIITRDRCGLYADGAQRGAPQARQVADRFHLLLNLREAVEKELGRQRRLLAVPPAEEDKLSSTTIASSVATCSASRANPEVVVHNRHLVDEQWAAKQELFDRVKGLHLAGRTASAIVRETGVKRRRVDKWIRCGELPERNRMEAKLSSPRFFETYLQRRWAEGCHEGDVLRGEIQKLGYTGCYSAVARFLSRWRNHEWKPRASAAELPASSVAQLSMNMASRHVSPLVAAALLVKPRPQLTSWQADKVDALKQACPDFARMRSLVMSFRGILRAGKPETLSKWMKKAADSGIYGMKRFVRTLHQDLEAVNNALRTTWSNRPVEGHINRLKTLKRAMYGRAGFELLRSRLLPMSHAPGLHQT